jgi:hypothetical protein
MSKYQINEEFIIEKLYKGAIISKNNSIRYINEAAVIFIKLCDLGVDIDKAIQEKFSHTIKILLEIELLYYEE